MTTCERCWKYTEATVYTDGVDTAAFCDACAREMGHLPNLTPDQVIASADALLARLGL